MVDGEVGERRIRRGFLSESRSEGNQEEEEAGEQFHRQVFIPPVARVGNRQMRRGWESGPGKGFGAALWNEEFTFRRNYRDVKREGGEELV